MDELSKKNKRSVFVVEDDLELSAVIDRILKSIDSSLHLDWATTAEEALSTLVKRSGGGKKKPYDLMISDIFLEGESTGLDLWKFCNVNYPTMKILIISGIEEDKLIDLIGPDHAAPLFLSKPFSVSECSSLLETILNQTPIG